MVSLAHDTDDPAEDEEDADVAPVAVATASGTKRVIIAIGGGKGGIGKSLIASNLGVEFALRKRRVVLVDADLGGANLHTCLGIPAPQGTLSDFLTRRVAKLEDIVARTTVDGLGLISGALDIEDAANPKYQQKVRLIREISRLDVDTIIIDLGAGTGFNILDFFVVADHGILTVVPEPTSIENAYRFIKATYYRRLKLAEKSWDLKPLVEEAMSQRGTHGLRTPADLVAFVEKRNPEGGAALRRELQRFPLKLVINQARSADEEKLGPAITAACRKYFGVSMELLGSIPYDDAVWRAIRARRPILLDAPNSLAAQSIRRVAQKIIPLDSGT